MTTATALKLNTSIANAPQTVAARPSLRRWTPARRLELAGVLSLMASSAAVALHALLHLA